MRRRLKWVDWFLLLVILGLGGFAGYDWYYNHKPPAKPPAVYRLDAKRRDEVARLTRRLAVEPKTWSVLIILPHPQLQDENHDNFMAAATAGELQPLITKTSEYLYTTGIHELPIEWLPYAAYRKDPELALFVLLYKNKAIYTVTIPPTNPERADGRVLTHVITDDVITTLKRWAEQQ